MSWVMNNQQNARRGEISFWMKSVRAFPLTLAVSEARIFDALTL
jgi:hypothetical protein